VIFSPICKGIEHHIGPARRQSFGDAQTNAGIGTGDHGGFACQGHGMLHHLGHNAAPAREKASAPMQTKKTPARSRR
jgi:hypothetical protein